MIKIGCFISPHGFGHSTRICAILQALSERKSVLPHIFTTVDKSVFTQNLGLFLYHHVVTDIGFLQDSAFDIDFPQTLHNLDTFFPVDNHSVESLAYQCRDMAFLLCDISPLGIAVARKAAIPSILVENFTWDWLYSFFRQEYPLFAKHCSYLESIYNQANFRIQTEPLCQRKHADLRCNPIYRKTTADPGQIRKSLDPLSRKIVVITLGGLGFTPHFLDKLANYPDYFFVITGQNSDCGPVENVHFLGKFSHYYHPDLINSADVVVFKTGYSTLAECYQCRKPSICIRRNDFPESPVLEEFAINELGATVISQERFLRGEWLHLLPSIHSPKVPHHAINGADQCADFLVALL